MAVASPNRDDITLGQAYAILAEERYWSGFFPEGIELSQQAIALLEPAEMPSRLGMAHFVLGLNALQSGAFAQALQAAEQALTLGLAIGDPHLPTFAEWLTGWTQATCGKWEAGLEACQRSLKHVSDPLSAAMALGWLGYVYLEHHEPVEAIPLLEQAIQRMKVLKRRRLEGLYTTFLSEAYLAHNERERAYDLACQGLLIAQQATYRVGVAWAQRSLGHISQVTDSLVAAEPYLRGALASFEAIQARFEIARTHLSVAKLAHAQSKREVALRHLTEADHRFRMLQVPTYITRT
ncbi:hypothetical protein C2W62_10840 [Candidatus Entotheonella serta]|nr:hypothetical protein C2W62_10840 [Candidatus Entotheonella serta]